MNRITQCLQTLKESNQKALVTYIVNGDPNADATLKTLHLLVEKGANIIELGVPFSDPMAEGPTIQRGHERALENKTSLRSTLEVVRSFRETNTHTPIVLMGYTNPVERMGAETFATLAREAGVDGLLTVDLPPEEAPDLIERLQAAELENIFLLAPTTSDERAEKIISMASGFLYYVSLKGVTGAGHLNVDEVNARITKLREQTNLPICVGFGIKDGESAKLVGRLADGVVVGSILVSKMGELADQTSDVIAKETAELITPIRKALDEL
jgi:tryptophan synthase alpha chain